MNVTLTGHDLDYDSSHYQCRHFTQKANLSESHNLAHLNCLSWSGIYSGWQNNTLCSMFYVDLISLNCLKNHHNR